MKVKVIKRYKDLELNKVMDPKEGEKETVCEMEEARAKVLIAKGYVQEVQTAATESKKTKTQ